MSSEREQERKRKLLEDWRQFLNLCGIKGKTRFMFTTVKYKPIDFSLNDSIRADLWKKHISNDFTSQNPVEVITVQLDAGTRSVLAVDEYDKKMMAESLYSTWMESFGKQALNLDNNYYYRDNPPAGYFITRYRRHENRSPVIKDQDWGGVNRKFIPLQTVTGSMTTANLALRSPTEQLKYFRVAAQYLPLVPESLLAGRGYHSVYLNSLNVRQLCVSDINALWGKIEEKQYPDIIKVALEFAALGILLDGLELYDYDQSRLRLAKDFYLGLEGAEGSALIEKQYGQDGQHLGKKLGLTTETDANLFLGLFGRILDGVIDNSEVAKQVHNLVKYWRDWNPTCRSLIASDLREALQSRSIADPPVILCNNSKILDLYFKAKIQVVHLEIKPEEQYLIEKTAKEIGFILPRESGKLVCCGERFLSERESYQFNKLVKGFFELLESHEAARLTCMMIGFGTLEEWGIHVVKVESAERQFGEKGDLTIPLQLPYLEGTSRLFVALSDPPEQILAHLLGLIEFTTYRHALRDLMDIRFIDSDAPIPVKFTKQVNAQHDDGGSETDATDSQKKNLTDLTSVQQTPLLNEEIYEVSSLSEDNVSFRQQNANPQTVSKRILEPMSDTYSAQTNEFEDWKSGLDPEEELGLSHVLVQDLAKSLAKGPEWHEKRIRQLIKSSKILPDNVIIFDVTAEDSKEFLNTEYNGQCQVCGTELHLSNGHKLIGTFYLLPVGQDNWWENRPFNILGLCPNCYALAKLGKGLELNNIFSTAKELIDGLALPEEVLEFKGDFYTVPITINGTNRRLVISKLHLNYFAALLEVSVNEVNSNFTTIAAEEADLDKIITNCSEVEQLTNKIYTLLTEAQYDQALNLLDKALALYPTRSTFYVDRGYIYDVKEEAQNALEWYNKALIFDPNEPDALNNATIILQSEGRYSEALTYCNRLIDLDQNNPSLHYLKGTILEDLNQYVEAAEGYEHCIALDKEHTDAYFRLGLILEEQFKDQKRALEMFDKVIELTPEITWATHFSKRKSIRRLSTRLG
ncbi:MAG: hypothetical protein APF81_20600 [Desulfosporosinus sp. BRH_c37]|nr:MAG: hypothetical protein APF81_20600 [Desulfosporosinus sp. BRH_c37]